VIQPVIWFIRWRPTRTHFSFIIPYPSKLHLNQQVSALLTFQSRIIRWITYRRFGRNCCVHILPWRWGQQFPPIYWYPPNYTASRLRMSFSWMDSRDPQILQSKFIAGLTNLSRSSVLQTEFGFFSRFTDVEVSSGGDRIPVGARFSALVQTVLGVHPASCEIDTGSLSRGQGGRSVATYV